MGCFRLYYPVCTRTVQTEGSKLCIMMRVFSISLLLLVGCGASIPTSDAHVAPCDAAVITLEASVPSCGDAPMPYAFVIRTGTGQSAGNRHVALSFPGVRSPIVAGELQVYFQDHDYWQQWSIPVSFDYRASGGQAMTDYLACMHERGTPVTLTVDVELPSDSYATALYGRFDELNRSGLYIGGRTLDSTAVPDCTMDLDPLCDGTSCPRRLASFTENGQRVCGLRL